MPKAAAEQTEAQSGDLISDDQRFESLISLDNLRRTWRQLRREVREQAVRDPVDWLDWSVTVDATLPQLRDSLLNGKYVPCTPIRYELAKSKGAYRVITVPNIRDCIVYRLLCDEALRVATPQKVRGFLFTSPPDDTGWPNTGHLRPFVGFFRDLEEIQPVQGSYDAERHLRGARSDGYLQLFRFDCARTPDGVSFAARTPAKSGRTARAHSRGVQASGGPFTEFTYFFSSMTVASWSGSATSTLSGGWTIKMLAPPRKLTRVKS